MNYNEGYMCGLHKTPKIQIIPQMERNQIVQR